MSGRKRKAEIKPAIVAYNYEDLKLLASTRKHWKAINSRVQEAAISVTTSNVFLGSEPEYLTQLFRDALWHSINYYCAHHPGITMLRKDWVLVDNVIFSMPLEETIPLMVWDWETHTACESSCLIDLRIRWSFIKNTSSRAYVGDWR